MCASEDMLALERGLWRRGYRLVAGVDEVGRGALAGPLVAAAAILPRRLEVAGLTDSKKLSPKARERIFAELECACECWAVAYVQPAEIDRIGIQPANLRAMAEAVVALAARPDFVLTDHFELPQLEIPLRGVDKGDATCRCIAAASVLAKVTRDRMMAELDADYPAYGFAENKGYGTARHLEALAECGPSPAHRYSFRHVGQMRLGGGL
ncbi:MAG: ribonuclease HII [Candidatus Geothermincolia bacterium]